MIGYFLRFAVTISIVTGLATTGWAILPRAASAARIFWLKRDPFVVGAYYQLSGLKQHELESEIEAALKKGDVDMALSLLEFAGEQNVPFSPELMQRVEEAQKWSLSGTLDDLRDAAVCDPDSPAGLVGCALTDLTVIGDMRDLTREALAYPNHDPVVLNLSIVGLTLTAATAGTGGAVLPIKIGVSFLKAAKKFGKLSKSLGDELIALTKQAIDTKEIGVLLTSAKPLDWDPVTGSGRKLIPPATLRKLESVGAAFAKIWKNHGAMATVETLQLANSTTDVSRLQRLSSRSGQSYRALLRLTKRSGKLANGAFKVTRALFEVAALLLSAITWFLSLCLVVGRWSVRATRFLGKRKLPAYKLTIPE